jgi:RNA polymerase sigma factor (sigma-70 family)
MPPPAHGLASRLIAGPTLRTQSDRRLVGLVREGYESAFEEIVRRYGRALGRYAAAIVGNRAEDVTQDAFSKALVALRRDEAEIELRPWLYRIVRNTALNDLRDRPAAAAELAEAIATGASPDEAIEQREELTELMKRLRALPEAQRAAIVMRELEGLGHEEIAAALGMSGGAARQAIYRARRALRDGAGMLVPLPLLRALLATEGSAAAAEAAGGAVGIAGAGLAAKATAATVLVAGTVGAGVALQDAKVPNDRDGTARAAVEEQARPGATAAPATTFFGDPSGSGSDRGPGGGGDEDESSGPGDGGEVGGDDSEHDDGESRNGPGDGSDEDDVDRSGPGGGELSSGSSGSGEDGGHNEEEVDDEEPSATSGSSGSGSSGSGSSGSGSASSFDSDSSSGSGEGSDGEDSDGDGDGDSDGDEYGG